MSMEVFKDVEEFKGHYQISNLGRVKNITPYKHKPNNVGLPRNFILKNRHDKEGYCCVALSVCGMVFYRKVHRLVAMAFIDNPENKPEVNHKDLNKDNNSLDNLEWVTAKENCHHHFRARGKFKNDLIRL